MDNTERSYSELKERINLLKRYGYKFDSSNQSYYNTYEISGITREARIYKADLINYKLPNLEYEIKEERRRALIDIQAQLSGNPDHYQKIKFIKG